MLSRVVATYPRASAPLGRWLCLQSEVFGREISARICTIISATSSPMRARSWRSSSVAVIGECGGLRLRVIATCAGAPAEARARLDVLKRNQSEGPHTKVPPTLNPIMAGFHPPDQRQ